MMAKDRERFASDDINSLEDFMEHIFPEKETNKMAKESGWLPTDEEIRYQIKYVLEHNDYPLEVTVEPLCKSVIKFTAKKIAERLGDECSDTTHYGYTGQKRSCPECWQSFLKEIEES